MRPSLPNGSPWATTTAGSLAAVSTRFELHVDGDVVAESDSPDTLAVIARRYAGYDRVAILRTRV